jgi:4-alpha-glucanotransferase
MSINPHRKLAGLLVPVFALRRPDDLGIGDTAAMHGAIDFCAANNMAVLQVLPINETGGDNSPYNAISSVALDPVLLAVDPSAVPGLTQEKIDEIASPKLLDELRSGAIKYPAVKRLKLDLFSAAFDNFRSQTGNSPQAAQFQHFKQQHESWLPQYTLFRTLVAEHDGDARWTEWEPHLRTDAGAEKWLAQSPDRERLERYREFCAFVQWIAFTQFKSLRAYARSKNVSIMGDIPFGVSRYSADVWAEPELFDLEWSGGAPPETFFQSDMFLQKWGQNWGIPLYNWDAHRSQDFAWWKQRVQRLGEFFHYFRIDHVLGFFRIYAFPWNPERNDEFVELTPEAAEELTGGLLPHFIPYSDEEPEEAEQNCEQGQAILQVVLEASGDMGVVAEDLGVVPDYVRPALQELGIPGFYIPHFERNEEDRSFKPKAEIPELSLGTWATHDHAPLRTLYEDMVERWHGPEGHDGWLEMQRLMTFLHLDENHPPKEFTNELHYAMLKAILESPCWLAMFMITDVLGTRQRFNEPGSSMDSNWSQRLDRPILEYANDAEFADKIRMLSRLIKESGRAPVAVMRA